MIYNFRFKDFSFNWTLFMSCIVLPVSTLFLCGIDGNSGVLNLGLSFLVILMLCATITLVVALFQTMGVLIVCQRTIESESELRFEKASKFKLSFIQPVQVKN